MTKVLGNRLIDTNRPQHLIESVACDRSRWVVRPDDARLEANPRLKAAKRFMGKLTLLSDLPSDSELIASIQEAMALSDKGVKLTPRQDAKPAKASRERHRQS